MADRRRVVALAVAAVVVFVAGVFAWVTHADHEAPAVVHPPEVVAAPELTPCPDRTDQVTGDPYSPPCVVADQRPVASKAVGVTDTEIEISYAVPDGADEAEFERTIDGLIGYANEHFQLHGRAFKARRRDPAHPAFADVLADTPAGADVDLASAGVVSIGQIDRTEAEMAARRPFLWSVAADCGDRLRAAVALTRGEQLPLPVAMIIDPALMARGCAEPATADAAAGGLDLKVVVADDTRAAVEQVRSTGAATVILASDVDLSRALVQHAADAGFHPQWVATDRNLALDAVVHSFDATTWGAALLVTDRGTAGPVNQSIGYAAYKTNRADEPSLAVDALYERIDLLAIGVELAGRDLTAATFEAGLRRFGPRPGPFGTWNTTAGYAATTDFAVLTWVPAAVSFSDGQPGSWASSDGRRFTPEQLAGP